MREIDLQIAVADLLKYARIGGWQWTHIGHGEKRDVATAARLKRMGVKRGWPDFLLISPTGMVRMLELKVKGGRLTADQQELQSWCIKHGVPYAVAWSFEEAALCLTTWGVIAERRSV